MLQYNITQNKLIMKVKLTLIAVLFAGIGLCQTTYAQTENREIGLRLTSSRGSDFVFKKEKKPNRYKRLRIGLQALGYNGNDDFNFGLTFGIGVEKRKSIREDLFFIHGLEPRLQVNSFSSSSNISVGLGYVFGFQYDISDALSANIEATPSVGTGIDGEASIFIDAGINSNAAISLVYKFQKQKK